MSQIFFSNFVHNALKTALPNNGISNYTYINWHKIAHIMKDSELLTNDELFEIVKLLDSLVQEKIK